MHLTGKIFAFFTLCLAIGAVILTAKVLDQQNEWNGRVEKSRDAYQKAVAEVPGVKDQVKRLEDDLTLQRLDWGRHWEGVDTLVNDQSRGILSVSIGRNDNLVRVTDAGDVYPTLYAFQPAGDTMVYVGAFRVTQVNVNQSAIQLIRPPRAGEAESWKPGKWRFRDGLPASKEGEIGDLLIDLTILEERVKSRRLNLLIQQKSVQNAQKLLAQRLKELNGDPSLSKDVEDVYRKGLIASLQEAQDHRDEALAEVQRLRDQLHDLYGKFEEVLTENKQLESGLRPTTKTGQKSDPLIENVNN